MWQKEKLHVLCNFFFCHYAFKKPSAAEASKSVYMRERVKCEMGERVDAFELSLCSIKYVFQWLGKYNSNLFYRIIIKFQICCYQNFNFKAFTRLFMIFQPFSTYNKSAADNLKNTLAKIWKIYINQSVILFILQCLSGSIHYADPYCWFSHGTAHIIIISPLRIVS